MVSPPSHIHVSQIVIDFVETIFFQILAKTIKLDYLKLLEPLLLTWLVEDFPPSISIIFFGKIETGAVP